LVARCCFVDMLWLSFFSCALSAGALLLGFEDVATDTAMDVVRLFALAGALFAAIALCRDLTGGWQLSHTFGFDFHGLENRLRRKENHGVHAGPERRALC
jgi:hypothetical protein